MVGSSVGAFDFWKAPRIDKLMILTVSFMFASFTIFNDTNYSTISVLGAAFVLFILHCIKTGWHISVPIMCRYQWDVIVFGVFCLISSLWAAASPKDANKAGITVLEICVCMTVVYIAFKGFPTIHPILKCIELGGYLIAAYSIVAYGGLHTMMTYATDGIRVGVEFANINAIGRILAIVVIVKLYEILHSKPKLTDLIILLPLAVIITCQSRMTIIELALGFFILLTQTCASKSQNWTNKILRVVFGVVVAFSVLYFLSTLPVFSGVSNRMLELQALFTGTGQADNSAVARRGMIELGLNLFSRHPILGIGMGNARHFNTYLDAYLHNNYVEMLADGGVIGFILFYKMHGHVLIQLNKYKHSCNPENLLCTVIVIMLLVSDIGGVSYYSKDFYFLLMACYLQIRVSRSKCMADSELVTVNRCTS